MFAACLFGMQLCFDLQLQAVEHQFVIIDEANAESEATPAIGFCRRHPIGNIEMVESDVAVETNGGHGPVTTFDMISLCFQLPL